MRTVTILGSTGSIGRSALRVVERFGDRLEVGALSAGNNTGLLARQVERYAPRCVALSSGSADPQLQRACRAQGCELLTGPEAAAELAARSFGPDEILVAAVTGAAGLEPTVAAVRAGKRIALANKEALVMAGRLVLDLAAESGCRILPVDSEHNAIFQCLLGQQRAALRRIILCASGGPLWGLDAGRFDSVTPEQALAHPRWRMGRKISIDSATMMNKGLEEIEARWLFDLEPAQISVVVHPQHSVHSLVEFSDGALLAQLGSADMSLPIQYCLSHPERWSDEEERFDLVAASPLQFYQPDHERFPALALAAATLEAGGTAPAALVAADEVAVEAFLEGRIRFTGIMRVVEEVMARCAPRPCDSLEAVRRAEREARSMAGEVIEALD